MILITRYCNIFVYVERESVLFYDFYVEKFILKTLLYNQGRRWPIATMGSRLGPRPWGAQDPVYFLVFGISKNDSRLCSSTVASLLMHIDRGNISSSRRFIVPRPSSRRGRSPDWIRPHGETTRMRALVSCALADPWSPWTEFKGIALTPSSLPASCFSVRILSSNSTYDYEFWCMILPSLLLFIS
jgi:hypothetical protein